MPRPVPRRVQRGSYRPLHHSLVLSEADHRVLRLLEQPPLRVWPRDRLAEAVGLSDRALRESISRLAQVRGDVLSDSGSGGYWIATGVQEVEKARSELVSRLRVIQNRVSAMDEVARLLRDREAMGGPAPALRRALV